MLCSVEYMSDLMLEQEVEEYTKKIYGDYQNYSNSLFFNEEDVNECRGSIEGSRCKELW